MWVVVTCLLLAMAGRGQTTSAGGLVPAYPGYHELRISEIQPVNRGTVFDAFQEPDPWIEIYNPGTSSVSLEGYALSDNYARFRRWRFPGSLQIPGGGYLLVWMDGQPSQTTASTVQPHANFRLHPDGGSIVLTRLFEGHPMVVDYIDYPAVSADLSFGMLNMAETAGSGLLIHPTPRGPNSSVPTVIVNEWYVSPPGEPGWFELFNPSGATVDLTGLVVTLTALDLQVPPLVIPKGHRIPGHGFLRIWADGQAALNQPGNGPLHAPFQLLTRPFTLQVLLPTGLPVSRVDSQVPNPGLPEARYPDGAVFFETVNQATPGAPNVGRPRFVEVPPSEIHRVGESLEWQARAEGTEPIQYQWYRNEAAIAGATSNRFSIPSLLAADTGTYMVRASNAAGSATAFARLAVNESPRISIDAPTLLTVTPGKSFRLPAVASGTQPLLYQWRRNGVNLPQDTQPSFLRDLSSPEDGGTYTLVVMNAGGAVLSIPVRVVVDVPLAKLVSDSFAERLDIGQALQGSLRGSNFRMTKELGEPQHAGNAGGHSVWFKWTPLKPGIASLNTRGSTFDTLLAVYAGTAVNALKRVESDDDGGGFYTSALQFNASAGVTYSIAIDGYGGDMNEFLLNWSLEVTEAQIPVIVRHPDSQTVQPGSTATFNVVASANAIAYQWLFNGKAIRGQTDTRLTVTKADVGDVGIYSVMVLSKDQRAVESNPARLELGDLPREISQDKYEPANPGFSLPALGSLESLELAGVPTVSVTAGTIGSQTLTTSGSFSKPGEPPPCGAIGGSSRYQVFVLQQEADVIIDTIGSTFNTTLTVYSLGKAPPFKYVDCDKNGSSSQVQFHGVPSTAYYAFVDSADGTSGIAKLNWRVGGVPQLVTPAPPMTNLVSAGATFSLGTTYVAAPPVTQVQWMLDGLLTAATTGTNEVLDAGADDTGVYSIVLSNVMGSVTGLVANICVDVPLNLSVGLSGVPLGDDILIQGLADQGFLVEASEDLVNWCAFGLSAVPSTPYAYTVSNPKVYPRLFFRCHPWPVDPSYTITPCAPGYP
jgi:hypothetical protein